MRSERQLEEYGQGARPTPRRAQRFPQTARLTILSTHPAPRTLKITYNTLKIESSAKELGLDKKKLSLNQSNLGLHCMEVDLDSTIPNFVI